MACIFTPLWVRAGSVPSEYDADSSRLNRRAHEIKQWVCEGDGVDTWRLTNPEHDGILDMTLPLETYLYNKTLRFLDSRNFSYDRLETFQNEVAQQAADSLDAWRPTYNVTEAFDLIHDNENIFLVWDEEDEDRFGGLRPTGYRIYRNNNPFRENDRGELIAQVDESYFRIENPQESGGFYRIEVVF